MWWIIARFAAKFIMGNSAVAFTILNVFRAINILTILGCMFASVAIIIKTSDLTEKIGWFNIADLAEKVLIILFALFLLLTELPKVLSSYFARQWPSFSNYSGFFALSVAMLFLGIDVLSYLTKESTDEKHLGGDIYRVVQAAGVMCVIMAVVNVVATLVFKDRKRGLTARDVRSTRKTYQPDAMDMQPQEV